MDLIEEKIELERLLDKWQCVLRLQDWDITAEVVNQKEMGATDRFAENAICSHSNHCTIKVLQEDDRKDQDDITPPARLTLRFNLVHELVHAILRDINDKVPEVTLERVVNHLTGVLLDMDDASNLTWEDIPVLSPERSSAACN